MKTIHLISVPERSLTTLGLLDGKGRSRTGCRLRAPHLDYRHHKLLLRVQTQHQRISTVLKYVRFKSHVPYVASYKRTFEQT